MSFDPALFDEHLFGAQSFSGECLFDHAIFDSAIFDTCEDEGAAPADVVPTGEPISNWQAHHRRIWKVRSKRELEDVLLQQRLALGIVAPPVERIEAIVAAAPLPEQRTDALDVGAPPLRPQDVHSDVYREYLAAELAIAQFYQEVADRRRRLHRAAIALLIH